MTRFLTANFLHMSMTALTASALDDFVQRPEKASYDATVTIMLVILMHGAYDFFLTTGILGAGLAYLSMGLFFFLARKFLDAVHQVGGASGAGLRLIDVFAFGTCFVVGGSFVYASALLGPGEALNVMARGALGVAFIAFVFVRELGRR
jgi:hypothetical protein